MDLIYRDRRRSLTTSTGTGDLTLTTGTGPWLPIIDADFSDNVFAYCVASVGGTEWEVGRGHLDTGPVLVRDFVLDSSAGGSGPSGQLTFSAGTKEVFCAFAADAADGVSELCEGGVLNAGRGGDHDTTNATPLVVTAPINSQVGSRSCVVEMTVIAQASDDKTKSFRVTYMVVWDGATATMYGESVTTIAESESLAWTVDASLSGTTHQLTLTGAAATNINWRTYGVIKAVGAA